MENIFKEQKKQGSKLVTVYKTGDAGQIAVVGSVLRSAGIYFFAKNEGEKSMFGYLPLFRDVEFQVRLEDEQIARQLLQGLEADEGYCGEVLGENWTEERDDE